MACAARARGRVRARAAKRTEAAPGATPVSSGCWGDLRALARSGAWQREKGRPVPQLRHAAAHRRRACSKDPLPQRGGRAWDVDEGCAYERAGRRSPKARLQRPGPARWSDKGRRICHRTQPDPPPVGQPTPSQPTSPPGPAHTAHKHNRTLLRNSHGTCAAAPAVALPLAGIRARGRGPSAHGERGRPAVPPHARRKGEPARVSTP